MIVMGAIVRGSPFLPGFLVDDADHQFWRSGPDHVDPAEGRSQSLDEDEIVGKSTDFALLSCHRRGRHVNCFPTSRVSMPSRGMLPVCRFSGACPGPP